MDISGIEFNEGDKLPEKHGYMGENVSPGLEISNVPEETSSLALVFADPDAEKMAGKTWIHWTLWNIPADTEKIEEGTVPGLEGTTDFRKTGYNGPNPPDGSHNVAFHLYALEEELELEEEASYEDLVEAMDGRVIEETVLEGIFC